jgi:hypothetical protein
MGPMREENEINAGKQVVTMPAQLPKGPVTPPGFELTRKEI